MASSQLRIFRQLCPFLGRTSPLTLRKMSTHSIMGVTRLRLRAQACPILGPVLSLDPHSTFSLSNTQANHQAHRHYAKTTNMDVQIQPLYKKPSQHIDPQTLCPLSHKRVSNSRIAQIDDPVPHLKQELFDYESFYNNELEKKHQDKSYR